METTYLLHPDQWAELTFGQALLGDQRRTRRAVKAACGMARDPSASLPKQQRTWKDLKAVYRLLDEPEVTGSGADAAALAADSRLSASRSSCASGAGYDGNGSVRAREHDGPGADR
ncbi:MAG TPA: transposase DNA-binding-containing protein [Ktedonobacterales bacterium]